MLIYLADKLMRHHLGLVCDYSVCSVLVETKFEIKFFSQLYIYMYVNSCFSCSALSVQNLSYGQYYSTALTEFEHPDKMRASVPQNVNLYMYKNEYMYVYIWSELTSGLQKNGAGFCGSTSVPLNLYGVPEEGQNTKGSQNFSLTTHCKITVWRARERMALFSKTSH